MADLGFELNEEEYPQTNFEPIPAGDYVAQIVDEQTKFTRSGGEMIVLKWKILEPERYADHIVFENVNVFNASADAQRIARERISNIMRAAGMKGISNTEALRFIPLKVSVIIKQDVGFEPKNEMGRKVSAAGGINPKAATSSGPAKPREAGGAGQGGAVTATGDDW